METWWKWKTFSFGQRKLDWMKSDEHCSYAPSCSDAKCCIVQSHSNGNANRIRILYLHSSRIGCVINLKQKVFILLELIELYFIITKCSGKKWWKQKIENVTIKHFVLRLLTHAGGSTYSRWYPGSITTTARYDSELISHFHFSYRHKKVKLWVLFVFYLKELKEEQIWMRSG